MPKERNQQLLDYIKEKGLNQTSFAKTIGVDRQTVISWINKTKETSLSSLHAMAAQFGEDPYELNEKLGLGVTLTETETEIQKLKKKVDQLAVWFSLPQPTQIEDKQKQATVNFVLGALEAHDYVMLDVLTETELSVKTWNRFYTTGEISSAHLKNLTDWLGLKPLQNS